MEQPVSASKKAETIRESLVVIAMEAWRFGKVFERALMKLDAGEQSRFIGQLRWFMKKVEESLASIELRIVNIEGLRFDPGMAARPLNIEDFDATDSLIVDQMLEPIIMDDDGIVKSGTITLRKTEL